MEHPVTSAIKKLRAELGDSQQAFANRLHQSISAIANYEAGRIPKERHLSQLAAVATEQKLDDLATVFSREYRARRAGRAEPTTLEERAFVRAILYLVRNRHIVSNWAAIRREMLQGLESICADNSGTLLTSPEHISSARKLLSETLPFITPRAQETITGLARARARREGVDFWTAYEQIVAENPQLQQQLELQKRIEQEAEQEEMLRIGHKSKPRKTTKGARK
jgi:transcriptional regulator with XRE-family HTH domain